MHLSKFILLLVVTLPRVSAAAPGTAAGVEGTASPQAVSVARTALAGEMYGADGAWTQASLPIGRVALLMRVQSGAFCGDIGCPAAVLLQAPGGWSAVWTGMSAGNARVLASAHHGLRDIAVAGRSGYSVLRFDGRTFVEGH